MCFMIKMVFEVSAAVFAGVAREAAGHVAALKQLTGAGFRALRAAFGLEAAGRLDLSGRREAAATEPRGAPGQPSGVRLSL